MAALLLLLALGITWSCRRPVAVSLGGWDASFGLFGNVRLSSDRRIEKDWGNLVLRNPVRPGPGGYLVSWRRSRPLPLVGASRRANP